MLLKKQFLAGSAVLLCAATAFCQPITRQVAISMIKNQIIANDTLNFNIYMYPSVSTAQFCVTRNGDTIHNPYAFSRLFFIDEMPLYNWGHPCSYIFIDTVTGSYQRVLHIFFPFGYKESMDSISESYDNDLEIHMIPPSEPVVYTNSFDPNKYALLFSGDYMDLRWNDLSHMYSALKLNGFTDENIFVFVPEEAENWDHNLNQDDNEDDFDGYCTYDNIENTLSELQSTLTEKDIFFFYCSTHGGYEDSVSGDSYLILQNDEKVMKDNELESMVQGFNCSEMIFVIDACFSGGFVPELEGNHRTVQTCTNKNEWMLVEPSLGYNFLTYAYATALKGYHPYKDPFQPWSINIEDGAIGQQDLEEIWHGWETKEDIDPDEVEHNGNGDGFYQTGEAFRYAAYLCGQIQDEGQNYQNHGFVEDLLSLYGIVGVVDHSQTIDGNFLIGDLLTVKEDVTLTINENSEIYLNKNFTGINTPQILVEHDGSIIVGDEVLFWGFDDENQIEIEGSCNLGSHDIFSATEDVRWVALNISNTIEEFEIVTCAFTNCEVNANCLGLEVSASEFTNSGINFTHGNLSVNECSFTYACIIASYPYGATSSINVDHCDFINTGYSSGSSILVDDYNSYVISNCTIAYDYHAHGIGIFNAGNIQFNDRLVTDCEIYNPPSRTSLVTEGIFVYNSISDIQNNNLHNNGYGIALLNNSQSTITGKKEFSTEEETQRIKNNVYNQVITTENCFPTKFEWNSIYNNNLTGTYINTPVIFNNEFNNNMFVKTCLTG